jgi:hypothetical protein
LDHSIFRNTLFLNDSKIIIKIIIIKISRVWVRHDFAIEAPTHTMSFCGQRTTLLSDSYRPDGENLLCRPRSYDIDLRDLEWKFKELQKVLHPDKFAAKDPVSLPFIRPRFVY